MNLFSKLRKPAWQSSNAQKRAAAVASADDPELLAALPRLALEDPDTDVRRQALRRRDDPSLYARAATVEADAELRAFARQRWLHALQHGRTAIDDDALAALTREEIERLASTLPGADERRRLLARIDRPGFLAERVLADPDPTLRIELLQRIDQVATLERIADQARKRDKRLARSARERAEQLQCSTGSQQAHQQRAEVICKGLEALLRDNLDSQQRRARLEGLEAEWAALDHDHVSDPLRTRYQGARVVIQAQLAPPKPAAPVVMAEPEPETTTEPESPSPEQIAAEARLQAQLAAQAEEAVRERELAQARKRAEEQARQQAEQHLDKLAASLEAGDLSQARALAAQIEPRRLGTAAHERWQQLQPQLKQLQGWEQWANNKVRARLCDDIEALIGSGLHPDALATRVREVQQQWRELDALEGRSEGSEATGLDKRFRVACARVLKPARGFFEKRDALRSEHQQHVEAFLASATALDDGRSADELLQLQRQAVEHLRGLGTLAPPARKRLANQLRTLLDAIKPRLEAHFSDTESARGQLIEQARALSQESDGRRVGVEARRLNQAWKELGKGRIGRDQAQWRQFRAALDSAFGQLDTRRRERDADIEQRREQARQQITQLEQLAALEGDLLSASQAQVRDIESTWRELALRDADLGEAYDNALTRHRSAVRDFERDQHRQRYLVLVDAEPDALQQPMQDEDAANRAALHLLFEAETLAGLTGPENESQARRDWQMQRLQRHLRGERSEGEQGLLQLLQRWRGLTGLSDDVRQRYRARLHTVIDTVLARG